MSTILKKDPDFSKVVQDMNIITTSNFTINDLTPPIITSTNTTNIMQQSYYTSMLNTFIEAIEKSKKLFDSFDKDGFVLYETGGMLTLIHYCAQAIDGYNTTQKGIIGIIPPIIDEPPKMRNHCPVCHLKINALSATLKEILGAKG